MSALLDFYRDEAPDIEGRMILDIWQWSQDRLEQTHDYIQWLFPLNVESNFNADAPLLTQGDQEAFAADELLPRNMRKSLDLFIAFLGLAQTGERIDKGVGFESKRALWSHPNHNWLRITRVLRSLRLCSLDAEARMLFKCLEQLHAERFVSAHSFEFWKRVME